MGDKKDHAWYICMVKMYAVASSYCSQYLGFVLCSAAVLYAAFTAVACVPVQDSYYSQNSGFVHTR